jgi:hypothetical protein
VKPRLLARLLLLLGLMGLAGATWGPWVDGRGPGLTLLGVDLAEYVKFLPAVRSGALPVYRQLFYLPLFTLSIGLSLAAFISAPWLRRSLRLILAIAAIPCALALLPPAWSPATFGQAEFQPQLWMLALALALALSSLTAPWLRPLPVAWTRRIRQAPAYFLALLALTATAIPLWQWLRVQPAIESVYHQPLHLGWGGWSLLIGGIVLAAGAVLAAQARSTTDA